MVKKILTYAVYAFLVIMVFAVVWLVTVELILTSIGVRALQKDTVIPTFTEQEVLYTHKYTDANTSPTINGTVFDIEGDGTQEIFVTGAAGQPDLILAYRAGALVDITADTNLSSLSATYDAHTLDVDLDDDDDLLVARDDNLYLYVNTEGVFTEYIIPLNIEDKAVIE